jgi:hypothetical protein
MRKKDSNFFEEHIEKIILAVVGLVCLWLLITRVVISPNRIEYSGRKLGPGEIDLSISREAELLKNKLDSGPEPLPPYKRRLDDFVGLVNLPIGDIDTSLGWPLPIYSSIDFNEKRKYHIPWIGEVSDATLEYIRAVAYVPIVEIDRQIRYDLTVSRPNDIDFVTVEAKFDIRGLYERFNDNFAGAGVEQEEWRDPCLAEPVFAAVQLQRRELNADGSLSEWYVVPRTKIDPYKKMFESIEEVEELPPGGMKVRLLQFDNAEVRMALLQPEAYKIATLKEEWFPPLLHKEYVEYKREIEMEKLRRAKEAEREEREQEREKAREEREDARDDRRSRTSGSRLSGGQYGGRRDSITRSDGRYGGTSRMGQDTRTGRGRDRSGRRGETDVLTRREEREEREREKELRLEEMRLTSARTTIDNLYKKLDEVLIIDKTDLRRLREPLVFWAHDDSLEPGKTYRYRIRLGVFNPVAGTNQFQEEDKDLKNQIVLWSDFSEIEEMVKIPGTLYFFPQDVKEAAKVVTVQVSKYALGYWYSKNFAVKPGEVIGAVADVGPVEKIGGVSSGSGGAASVSLDAIDYGTGAVLVDVVSVDDWSGGKNMYARHYYNMLYSFDGVGIEQIPVSPRYWGEDLRNQLNEIRKSQQEPREQLRGWNMKLTSMALAPELEYRSGERREPSPDSRRERRERPRESRSYSR